MAGMILIQRHIFDDVNKTFCQDQHQDQDSGSQDQDQGFLVKTKARLCSGHKEPNSIHKK